MSVSLLRVVFCVLLVAIATDRLWPSTELGPEARERASIVRTLAMQGLTALDDSARPRNVIPVQMHFRAPGCDQILQVMTAGLSLHEAPLLEAHVAPGFARRYVYFGRTWPTADLLAMRIEWLKYKVLAVLGLRRSVMPKTVLLVAASPDCRVIEEIDWRPLWDQRGVPGQPVT